jgi:hypothetical protein
MQLERAVTAPVRDGHREAEILSGTVSPCGGRVEPDRAHQTYRGI